MPEGTQPKEKKIEVKRKNDKSKEWMADINCRCP
jgi:hypothetical protein